MRVVLDCNVLISAARTDGVCRRVVVEAVRHHEIVLSGPILAEYREVAAGPKHVRWRDTLMTMSSLLASLALEVEPDGRGFGLPDPDDEVYLATALAGNAGALITGNSRHFPAGSYDGIAILSPRQFLDHVRLP